MKSLKDLRDENNIALKAYTDILVQKCRDLNMACVILISTLGPADPATYMAHNLRVEDLPNAVRQFANIIDTQPSGHSAITLTDGEPS